MVNAHLESMTNEEIIEQIKNDKFHLIGIPSCVAELNFPLVHAGNFVPDAPQQVRQLITGVAFVF